MLSLAFCQLPMVLTCHLNNTDGKPSHEAFVCYKESRSPITQFLKENNVEKKTQKKMEKMSLQHSWLFS